MAELDEELYEAEDDLVGASGDAAGIYEPEAEADETREEVEERAAIATALPLMEELLDWFTEQIAASDSIEQLMATKQMTGLELEQALHAQNIVATLLKVKKASLQARYEAFTEGGDDDEEV